MSAEGCSKIKDDVRSPFGVIRAAKAAGVREVIVAFSSGKDSLAVLDLCAKNFDRVVPYFMYFIKGLSFQESYLKYVESKYSLEILRVPDWRLCNGMREGLSRHITNASSKLPRITWRELEHSIRARKGIHWIASGETCNESLQRRGMITACNGIDVRRGHFYPIGFWSRKAVESYISQNDIHLSSEYRIMSDGRSFGGLAPQKIADIKNNYPEDYAKIKKLFPLADVQAIRFDAGGLVDKARNTTNTGDGEATQEPTE